MNKLQQFWCELSFSVRKLFGYSSPPWKHTAVTMSVDGWYKLYEDGIQAENKNLSLAVWHQEGRNNYHLEVGYEQA